MTAPLQVVGSLMSIPWIKWPQNRNEYAWKRNQGTFCPCEVSNEGNKLEVYKHRPETTTIEECSTGDCEEFNELVACGWLWKEAATLPLVMGLQFWRFGTNISDVCAESWKQRGHLSLWYHAISNVRFLSQNTGWFQLDGAWAHKAMTTLAMLQ
jgi:hypothetical protein